MPHTLLAFPDETGYDATPTLRCVLCNGVGALKPIKTINCGESLEPNFLAPAVCCHRCLGGGLDPERTYKEIAQGYKDEPVIFQASNI